MTTNYLDEADQLCDRIAIIDGGRIKALGSPTELKIGLGGDIVSLTIREQDRVQTLADALKSDSGDPRRRDQAQRAGHPRRFSGKGPARDPGSGEPVDLPD